MKYEPSATATALAEAQAELKRMRPVYRAALACVKDGWILDENMDAIYLAKIKRLENAIARALAEKARRE